MTAKRKMALIAAGFFVFEALCVAGIIAWVGWGPGLILGLCWPTLVGANRHWQDKLYARILIKDAYPPTRTPFSNRKIDDTTH